MADVSVVGQLESFLQVARERSAVIASNMANVDTPGYHTRDMDFSRELQRATQASEAGSAPQAPRLTTVKGLLERPDGNNVDVDRESMLLAETQLQYEAGTELLKSRFHQLLSAISGGA